jgi:hypothetical protein
VGILLSRIGAVNIAAQAYTFTRFLGPDRVRSRVDSPIAAGSVNDQGTSSMDGTIQCLHVDDAALLPV